MKLNSRVCSSLPLGDWAVQFDDPYVTEERLLGFVCQEFGPVTHLPESHSVIIHDPKWKPGKVRKVVLKAVRHKTLGGHGPSIVKEEVKEEEEGEGPSIVIEEKREEQEAQEREEQEPQESEEQKPQEGQQEDTVGDLWRRARRRRRRCLRAMSLWRRVRPVLGSTRRRLPAAAGESASDDIFTASIGNAPDANAAAISTAITTTGTSIGTAIATAGSEIGAAISAVAAVIGSSHLR